MQYLRLAEKTKRTRLQPIRTASEITANIIIQPLERIPLYQRLSKKIIELRLLGMLHKEIAKNLNISKRTVTRACKFQKMI